MHSSRMRTVRCSGRLGGGAVCVGVCLPRGGGVCPRDLLGGGVSAGGVSAGGSLPRGCLPGGDTPSRGQNS